MELDRMKAILELMREQNVAAFEVGDFKVSFNPMAHVSHVATPMEAADKMPAFQALNHDLGIDDDWED